MDCSRYRVLVLPDKIRLHEELLTKVRDYLAGGGKVIASHHSGLSPTVDQFVLTELGVRNRGDARYSPDFVAAGAELCRGIPSAQHVMFDRGLEVEAVGEAWSQADVWRPYFNRTYAHFCSHRHSPAESPSGFPAVVATENTVYFAHPIFSSYMRHGVRTYKLLFLNALKRLLPEKLVETNAPTTAHVSLARQGERTIAHVLHYIPEQRYREIQTIEEAIPLHGVSLRIRLEGAPSRVYLAPERADLPFTWNNGRVEVTIPRVDGHAMVVFE
jgi:hypothetical protein